VSVRGEFSAAAYGEFYVAAVNQRVAWTQRLHATLYHHGVPELGCPVAGEQARTLLKRRYSHSKKIRAMRRLPLRVPFARRLRSWHTVSNVDLWSTLSPEGLRHRPSYPVRLRHAEFETGVGKGTLGSPTARLAGDLRAIPSDRPRLEMVSHARMGPSSSCRRPTPLPLKPENAQR
jgi:hypothetical protein